MLSRWLFRLGCAAALVVALAYVPYRLARSDGYQGYERMRGELHELERGNLEIREKNKALRREIHRLRNDLDAIGETARDELGMVTPGEIVIQLAPGTERP
jgi:cell division protein FtsB